MYWTMYMSTGNWPTAYGYVVGVDWFQAVENARIMWRDAHVVFAFEEGVVQ